MPSQPAIAQISPALDGRQIPENDFTAYDLPAHFCRDARRISAVKGSVSFLRDITSLDRVIVALVRRRRVCEVAGMPSQETAGRFALVTVASGVRSLHSLEHGETFHPV